MHYIYIFNIYICTYIYIYIYIHTAHICCLLLYISTRMFVCPFVLHYYYNANAFSSVWFSPHLLNLLVFWAWFLFHASSKWNSIISSLLSVWFTPPPFSILKITLSYGSLFFQTLLLDCRYLSEDTFVRHNWLLSF